MAITELLSFQHKDDLALSRRRVTRPNSPSETNDELGGPQASVAPDPVVRKTDWTPIVGLVGVIITAAVTMVGYIWSTQATLQSKVLETRGAFDAKMVEIGVGILSADPGKDVIPARQWAIDLVEQHSGLAFSSADRAQLLHHPIQQGPSAFRLNGRSADATDLSCEQWKHNSDGSWSSIGTVLLNGVQLENVTFKNTGETAVLDAKCGATGK